MLVRHCLVAIVGLVALGSATRSATAQPLAPGQTLPPQPPPPPQQPFVLSPQEQANLDALLTAWEHHSSQVQTLRCDFTKFEYDANWAPPPDFLKGKFTGEIKFAKPDKGMYRVNSIEEGDYWVCDGKAIYSKDYKGKTVREYRLPPELQGKAISDGPLPFVFGVEAEKLKQRYWMRVTPPATTGQVWLEAYPKHARDAQNFRKVEIILSEKDLTPLALQIFLPSDRSDQTPKFKVSEVYMLTNVKKNDMSSRLLEWIGQFVPPPTPIGWKRVVEDNSATANVDKLPPQSSGRAERPLSLPPRR